MKKTKEFEIVPKYAEEKLIKLLASSGEKYQTKPSTISAFLAPCKLKLPSGDIVEEGDYIVRHFNGNFFGCTKKLFEKTYSPIN